MKIDNNNIHSLQTQKSENTQQVEKQQRQAERAAAEPQRDRFEVSDKARLLAKARTTLSDLPEVNKQRVEDLKNQVQQGTYLVPVEELAKKMLGNIDVKG